MNDYVKVTFRLSPYDEMQADILVAALADYGYECFEPTADEPMLIYPKRFLMPMP